MHSSSTDRKEQGFETDRRVGPKSFPKHQMHLRSLRLWDNARSLRELSQANLAPFCLDFGPKFLFNFELSISTVKHFIDSARVVESMMQRRWSQSIVDGEGDGAVHHAAQGSHRKPAIKRAQATRAPQRTGHVPGAQQRDQPGTNTSPNAHNHHLPQRSQSSPNAQDSE